MEGLANLERFKEKSKKDGEEEHSSGKHEPQAIESSRKKDSKKGTKSKLGGKTVADGATTETRPCSEKDEMSDGRSKPRGTNVNAKKAAKARLFGGGTREKIPMCQSLPKQRILDEDRATMTEAQVSVLSHQVPLYAHGHPSSLT